MITRPTLRKLILLALLMPLVSGAVSAQQVIQTSSSLVVTPAGQVDPAAPDIIFSNLDPRPGAHYNSTSYAFGLAGQSAAGETEDWVAVSFVPRVDTRAQVLSVPIGNVSGTNLVNLGIYTDNILGTVGTLVPGSLVSLTPLPTAGGCCELATATLPGDGVLLTGGTCYWLAATADDVNAPTFRGAWQLSNLALSADRFRPAPWDPQPGQWPAALIRGTNVETLPGESIDQEDASPNNAILYTTLGSGPSGRFANYGFYVVGNHSVSQPPESFALSFTLRENAHAKTLAAAIGYIYGTKKVNLGLYSDNGGNVGTLLPGGQGSTTNIPDAGSCCDLTKVTLPGAGVALTKGTLYWLVATPDEAHAADFLGIWQETFLSAAAYSEPENWIAWTSFPVDLLAAEIRGTNP